MTIAEAFNASIEYYDDWMKKALPNYVDIFGTALELLPFEPDASLEVLDLGAGDRVVFRACAGEVSQSHFCAV
jgi:hypothetical protein